MAKIYSTAGSNAEGERKTEIQSRIEPADIHQSKIQLRYGNESIFVGAVNFCASFPNANSPINWFVDIEICGAAGYT